MVSTSADVAGWGMYARCFPFLAPNSSQSWGRRAFLVCFLTLVGLSSCGSPSRLAEESPTPAPSQPVETPTPLPTASAIEPGAWHATAVAYTTHVWDSVPSDLWLYDVRTDQTRRLTT